MCFFFQAEDGIRDLTVTGVQTCALPISARVGPGDRLRELGAVLPEMDPWASRGDLRHSGHAQSQARGGQPGRRLGPASGRGDAPSNVGILRIRLNEVPS